MGLPGSSTMRTALISDVHANLAALKAVLAHIDSQGVDRILSLGDVIGYGPDPAECVDLVADRCEWSLLGNHDYAVLYEPTNFNAAAERAAFWTRRQLEPNDRWDTETVRRRWEFLGRMRVRVVEGDILAVHGSPRRPVNEYLFPDDVVQSPSKLASVFERIDRACLVGHTHFPGVFTDDPEFFYLEDLDDNTFDISDTEKVIINPGSVGQPRDQDPRASYAILEHEPSKAVGGKVTFYRVEYPIDETVEKIRAIDELPDWLGERLLQGR
ncbi:MAG: metallophosphoesterase family protein [Planctomycetota bacterium]|nr:metallophosphoesterase family protein [Planctomycetota bacterium]MDA1105347.1 metallophosphoesterase family protein [Planctomycetota bacterium]